MLMLMGVWWVVGVVMGGDGGGGGGGEAGGALIDRVRGASRGVARSIRFCSPSRRCCRLTERSAWRRPRPPPVPVPPLSPPGSAGTSWNLPPAIGSCWGCRPQAQALEPDIRNEQKNGDCHILALAK